MKQELANLHETHADLKRQGVANAEIQQKQIVEAAELKEQQELLERNKEILQLLLSMNSVDEGVSFSLERDNTISFSKKNANGENVLKMHFIQGGAKSKFMVLNEDGSVSDEGVFEANNNSEVFSRFCEVL